jgi:hypothetical protein
MPKAKYQTAIEQLTAAIELAKEQDRCMVSLIAALQASINLLDSIAKKIDSDSPTNPEIIKGAITGVFPLQEDPDFKKFADSTIPPPMPVTPIPTREMSLEEMLATIRRDRAAQQEASQDSHPTDLGSTSNLEQEESLKASKSQG